MNINGSQTETNLMTAFAGESQARNRYTYAASKAKKEGYIQISQVFEETANQEKEHAKRFFNFLEHGQILVKTAFPAGPVGTTAENLRDAAGGEHHEWSEMYPGFAKIAREEGFETIATVFENVSIAEKQHEKRFNGLLANIEKNIIFMKDTPVVWRCLNCGFVHEGKEAPTSCPACAHPQAYFELLAENW